MKIINFKLSKKLNDAGLLDELETEYYYHRGDLEGFGAGMLFSKKEAIPFYEKIVIKTITLSEAIESLPKSLNGYSKHLEYDDSIGGRKIFYDDVIVVNDCNMTLLQAIEKMLNYLLDNNLIGQKV